MKIYFSSDWHLGHTNVIKYDNRPFKTVEEMDHAIISNVTKPLKKGNSLYYLGDFALTRSINAMEGYMKALAYTEANLFFIRGNHDKKEHIKLYQTYGTYFGEQKKIKIPDAQADNGVREIVLNHYAMRVWDKSHWGSWHLYGHSHHHLPDDIHSLSFDVGINGWDYQLIDYETVKKKMSTKLFKPIDNHRKSKL